MLAAAGLELIIDPADVDEAALKEQCRRQGLDAASTAAVLAEAKARPVSARHGDRLVIAADQMLECEGRWFDKPAGREAAKSQLLALSGRSHRLVSAVVVYAAGSELWRHTDQAILTMRSFDGPFLERYLDAAGSSILSSVGAYRLESVGVHLFQRIDGDHFTILGLPLLPLLGLLRQQGVLAA
jgi:septum formation protein